MTIAKLFEKDYWRDSMDLSDFNAHNVIEHDASIVRADAYFQPDQGVPTVDVIEGLLRSATGVATIDRQRVKVCTYALKRVVRFRKKRRAESTRLCRRF